MGMRLKTLPAVIGLLALSGAISAEATASAASRETAALKRVGVSWVTYASRGNARKACRLQTEANVNGVACGQLPSYGEAVYCPANPNTTRWRVPAEEVVNVRIKGSTGSATIRSSSRRSGFRVGASFRKLGGRWRISSIHWAKRRLAPAGLIFTEGKRVRERLWPAHC
jgi:hypothetical protein